MKKQSKSPLLGAVILALVIILLFWLWLLLVLWRSGQFDTFINCFGATKDAGDGAVACFTVKGLTFVNLFEGSIAFIGLVFSAVVIWLLAARLSDQQRQTEIQTDTLKNQQALTTIQIRKETNERFNAAIELLGSADESVRTGAIYSLHRLANESPAHHGQLAEAEDLATESRKYRNQVAKILCAHIRHKTRDKEYKDKNSDNPSNEIQTAIDLLFRDVFGEYGLYPKFSSDLPPADLSASYLVGADFIGAQCKKTFFIGANCQGAIFREANCQGAVFGGANCYNANFWGAKCQGTTWKRAHIQRANFANANCQGAGFSNTRCQEAKFYGAELQGAYAFSESEDHNFLLSQRIGKNTELETMIVFTKGLVRGCPAYIKVGVLEDSPGLQKIIRELEVED